jgi:hypothetical protein
LEGFCYVADTLTTTNRRAQKGKDALACFCRCRIIYEQQFLSPACIGGHLAVPKLQ